MSVGIEDRTQRFGVFIIWSSCTCVCERENRRERDGESLFKCCNLV